MGRAQVPLCRRECGSLHLRPGAGCGLPLGDLGGEGGCEVTFEVGFVLGMLMGAALYQILRYLILVWRVRNAHF